MHRPAFRRRPDIFEVMTERLARNGYPARALSGDLEPKWVEVWAHIFLGKIFDVSDQRDRAVNEYRQALRTKDNTYGALEEAGKYVNQKYEKPRNTN